MCMCNGNGTKTGKYISKQDMKSQGNNYVPVWEYVHNTFVHGTYVTVFFVHYKNVCNIAIAILDST